MRVLYLTYDGLTDPLGQSQILPYLVGLTQQGHEFDLVSCEKPERPATEREQIAALCSEAGIRWQPLVYHARPPVLSTLRDIAAMRRKAAQLQRERGFDLIHCRGYVTPLVAERLGLPFIFDMRAFWPDERMESGLWRPEQPLLRAVYRFFKRREARWLNDAAGVVSLTEAARRILLARSDRTSSAAAIDVIPCCVDRSAFPPVTAQARELARAELGIDPEARVAVALGSLTGWYRLDRMLQLFAEQLRRDPKARMLFITRDDPAGIHRAAAAADVSEDALIIRAAQRSEVPRWAAAGDYGVLFGTAGPSQAARSPVKLGELMALELPIVTDRLIGDVAEIIDESGAGILVDDFDTAAYGQALDALAALKPDMQRWRRSVARWFDLAHGIERYDDLYRRAATDRKSSTRRGA